MIAGESSKSHLVALSPGCCLVALPSNSALESKAIVLGVPAPGIIVLVSRGHAHGVVKFIDIGSSFAGGGGGVGQRELTSHHLLMFFKRQHGRTRFEVVIESTKRAREEYKDLLLFFFFFMYIWCKYDMFTYCVASGVGVWWKEFWGGEWLELQVRRLEWEGPWREFQQDSVANLEKHWQNGGLLSKWKMEPHRVHLLTRIPMTTMMSD